MIQFNTRKDMETWFNTRPKETMGHEAAILAGRAALRVLPLLAREFETKQFNNHEDVHRILTSLVFPVFQTSAAARFMAFTTKGNIFFAVNFAFAANSAVVIAAANAAADAARASAFATFPDFATAAAFAATDASGVTVAADVAVAAEVAIVEQAGWQALIDHPLWPQGEPKIISDNWKTLRSLLANETNWAVWIDFYTRLRDGKPQSEDELAILTLENAPYTWQDGPEKCNRWITEQLAVLRAEKLPDEKRDFFISYSTKDELFAKDVNATLEEAGFSTYVQFKDFGPGSNFIREMQRGLKGSSRFIALHSPDYEASQICQDEWAVAYYEDPGALKRKIVPFLLKPMELSSLARQISYTSLISLEGTARRDAILAAVRYTPPNRSKATLKKELEDKASPDATITHDNKLDAIPNAQTDKPYVDIDLDHLIDTQLVIVETLKPSFTDQTPKPIIATITSYGNHLGGRRANFITNLLNQLASPVETGIASADFGNWGGELRDLMGSFLRNHARLTSYHINKQERDRLFSETPINETDAVGDALFRPIKNVDNAVKAAPELTTEAFAQVHADITQAADNLANEPMPSKIPPETIITPKRRLVLMTIGFYERVYNFIGSTASIASTTQGQTLLLEVGKALEALWKFIPLK